MQWAEPLISEESLSVPPSKGTQTLFSVGYGYTQGGGNNGQITSITDTVDAGRSVNYTYDALGRLSSAVTIGSAAYPKWGLSWTYDRYGNRTAQTVTAGTAPQGSSKTGHAGSPENRP